MGLFGKSDEEKREEELKKLKQDQEKIKEALLTLGVDFDSYSDDQIKERNKRDVLDVRAGMTQSITSNVIIAASLKSAERLVIMRLMDIVSQNWILIRQNELLIRKLDKVVNFFKERSTR